MKKKIPKIVFLDAATVDWGDIDFQSLQKIGDLKIYNKTTKEQTFKRIKDAEIIITNKVGIHEKEIFKSDKLKLICVAATGYNNLNVKSLEKRNIAVSNVSGYSTDSVAELTLLFMLNLGMRFSENQSAVKNKNWSKQMQFCYSLFPFQELKNKTLGVIGFGNIGRKVSKLAKAFGMKVVVAKIPGRQYAKNSNRESLIKVFKTSDFISLHCPLTSKTRHLINKNLLSKMKSNAFLINMARGDIVNEKDVYQALLSDNIRGFASDVMSKEPPNKNHFFFDKKLNHKILLTPHIAWGSYESRQRLVEEIAKNIKAFLNGRKRNRVDDL